jgi:gliding motility-associated-like protein
VEILFLPTPNPQIEGETEFCQGEVTTLTATGGQSYSWSNGMSGEEITASSGGILTVTAVDTQTGCAGSASVSLIVNPRPTITLPTTIEKCIEVPVTLRPEVTGADGLAWSTGDSTQTLEVSGQGSFTLIAFNSCGESRTEVAVIEDECFQTLFIPNAFTPNGDGINDLFRVYGERIFRFKIKIYDRLGTSVFESNSVEASWNGSYQNSGYYCETGMYAVHVELEYEDKSLLVKTGHVNLLR